MGNQDDQVDYFMAALEYQKTEHTSRTFSTDDADAQLDPRSLRQCLDGILEGGAMRTIVRRTLGLWIEGDKVREDPEALVPRVAEACRLLLAGASAGYSMSAAAHALMNRPEWLRSAAPAGAPPREEAVAPPDLSEDNAQLMGCVLYVCRAVVAGSSASPARRALALAESALAGMRERDVKVYRDVVAVRLNKARLKAYARSEGLLDALKRYDVGAEKGPKYESLLRACHAALRKVNPNVPDVPVNIRKRARAAAISLRSSEAYAEHVNRIRRVRGVELIRGGAEAADDAAAGLLVLAWVLGGDRRR